MEGCVKSKTMDRRIQKTLKLLHEALMALVVEKKYERISVQEILDRANVGRSTFYTHYRDKDELLLNSFDDLRAGLEASQAVTPVVAGKSYERIIGFSHAMFAHAQGYRQVYAALIRSEAGPIVRQRIQKVIMDLIRVEFKKDAAKGRRTAANLPSDLVIHYLASTLLSLLEWWVGEKSELSPESMNSIYRTLVLPLLSSKA